MSGQEEPLSYDINIPYAKLNGKTSQSTRYPKYLPTWDKIWYDPLPPFEYHDAALRVKNKELPNLLTPAVTQSPIQPRLGSVVEGVQLNKLSDLAKDELAYLISQRKVLVFPDQDLIDASHAEQEEFMRYFGKLNYQPVSGSIKGHPAFHIIHRDGDKEEIEKFLQQKTTTTLWHQDVSYEHQPPGYVMLGLLEGPDVGGDTIFAAMDTALKLLSPTLQSFLENLDAVHSSKNMIEHTRAIGGLVRKDPVTSIHPLVRVHPVTGNKCLFVNGEFITRIVGLKEPEKKMILDFVMQHIITGHDFQARVRWSPRTIVMFDNRSTIHSAVVDYVDDEHGAKLRHIFRLCAMAEEPVPVRHMNGLATNGVATNGISTNGHANGHGNGHGNGHDKHT